MERILKQHSSNLANNKEIYLKIKVLPNTGKTEIKKQMADKTIKIAVAAPPEKNKANKELIKFLAKNFGISSEKVKIISGASDRLKLIKIIK